MYRDVVLTDTDHLAADLTHPADEGKPWIVFMHGLCSNRKSEKALFLEQVLTERGFGFARFDFRGHGESSGGLEQLTISRALADLQAVLATIDREHGLERVILVGSSLGAMISAWHCALNPGKVAGQVLVAPAFRIVERMLQSIGETGRERWQQLRSYHFVSPWVEFDLGYEMVTDSKHYPAELLPRRTQVPTVILHGTEDQSVPLRSSEDFVMACAEPRPRLVRVPGGDHRLTHAKELLSAEVLALALRTSIPTAPLSTVGIATRLTG